MLDELRHRSSTEQDLARTLAAGAEHYGLTGLAAFTPPIRWLGAL